MSRASYISGDPYAMHGETGTVALDGSQPIGILNVNADYAVFAPGTFPGTTSGANPNPLVGSTDPSGGNDYVYAYVLNNLPTSTLPISSFSVGLLAGSGVHNVGTNSSLGGTPPAPQFFNATSFLNDFYGVGTIPGFTTYGEIAPGSSSDILLFTSPFAPTVATSYVANGALNPSGALPSPVPEPATGAILAIVGIFALRRRNRHI